MVGRTARGGGAKLVRAANEREARALQFASGLLQSELPLFETLALALEQLDESDVIAPSGKAFEGAEVLGTLVGHLDIQKIQALGLLAREALAIVGAMHTGVLNVIDKRIGSQPTRVSELLMATEADEGLHDLLAQGQKGQRDLYQIGLADLILKDTLAYEIAKRFPHISLRQFQICDDWTVIELLEVDPDDEDDDDFE